MTREISCLAWQVKLGLEHKIMTSHSRLHQNLGNHGDKMNGNNNLVVSVSWLLLGKSDFHGLGLSLSFGFTMIFLGFHGLYLNLDLSESMRD